MQFTLVTQHSVTYDIFIRNNQKISAAWQNLKIETVFPHAQLVSILIRLKQIRCIYIRWSELNDDIYQCNQPGSISIQLKQRGSTFITFNGCYMNKSYKLKSTLTRCLHVQCDLTVRLPDLITIWLHSYDIVIQILIIVQYDNTTTKFSHQQVLPNSMPNHAHAFLP